MKAPAGGAVMGGVTGIAELDQLFLGHAAKPIAAPEQHVEPGALDRLRLERREAAAGGKDFAFRARQQRRLAQSHEGRLELAGAFQPSGEISDDGLDAGAVAQFGFGAGAYRPAEFGELALVAPLARRPGHEAEAEGRSGGQQRRQDAEPVDTDDNERRPRKPKGGEPDQVDNERNSGAAHPVF